ncbi:MAG: AAA family ATPase, partial [Lachnospiraceae bacterium]|nr:AAA family ATPase [Lachnospiraceae bacterium]
MQEEQEHFGEIQKIIGEQLQDIDISLDKSREDIIKQKKYFWENLYEMDPKEIAANRTILSEDHDSYEFKENQKRLLLKMQGNPYFGRVDFIYDGECEAEPLYIGLGGLRRKNGPETLIYDWRAPISGMYYDFDIGKAFYEAPMGRIEGEICRKRQIKIKKGVLEYVLDSDFKVDDEILQKELSGNGSTKMRNIVATIQKEQNSIVRNQSASVMLVQGVAGSGKTSIALHRIAFLLYHNRKNLHSSEILILSPNNIFADYISNVLPELGEENISEVSFDEIAEHELAGICKFEKKYVQMEYVIGCKSEEDERLSRIRLKGSMAFLRELQ